MDLSERIAAFTRLGSKLRDLLNEDSEDRSYDLTALLNSQQVLNPWFTPKNVRKAISAIANELTGNNLRRWTGEYPYMGEDHEPVRVGVIMAGNIPLAGFHDFISVLISGNILVAKTSSKDSQLINFLSRLLIDINPGFKDKIEITGNTIKEFDMVIATGSDNSSRYFDYYFSRYPNIIRKNRNSIAVIDGNETDAELCGLGDDIFSYFGLGCRNVSKVYLPTGYDPALLARHWSIFEDVISNQKYANNYDFNKAVYLVNREKFFDTGYLLLKEDARIASPVSVLYYEHYDSLQHFNNIAKQNDDKIQCIVGRNHVPFGEAQSPHLWDYADGVDTLEFLLKKKSAGIL